MKTLNDLKTDNDVFNYVSSFLLNQKEKSMIDQNNCAYRGYDNMKCAIGCIIDDKFYYPKLEHNTIHNEIVQNAVSLSLPQYTLNEDFLIEMQLIHDNSNVESWENLFSEFKFDINGNWEVWEEPEDMSE